MLCRADGATELLVFQTWLLVSASRDFAPAGASRWLCGRPRHPFAALTHAAWLLSQH